MSAVGLLAVAAPPLVRQLAVVVLGAAAVAYVCTRIKLVPIVGFVVAGAIVGPNALGLVHSTHLVEQAAEIGVVFLLFGIGLELSAEKLRSLGALLLGGGSLQVGLTVLLVAGVCMVAGVDTKNAVYTGCLVALSSTAIVLKLLSGRGETDSPVGGVAVAFLIFQDLAVVVMVLLVPMLGGDGGGVGDIVVALGKSAVVIVFVLVGTRWLLPRALDKVSQYSTDEVYLLSVAAFALIVAYIASEMGLTASLGAFIAGLVISSSSHRERALRYVTPFQMLFSAIFFASIGMLLDLSFVFDHWALVLVLAVGAIVLKFVGTAIAAAVFHRSVPVAVTAGLLLAQVGEFAFVLELSGRKVGLSPAGVGADGSQAFIATAVVLFVLTPLLDGAGRKAGDAIARRRESRAGAT